MEGSEVRVFSRDGSMVKESEGFGLWCVEDLRRRGVEGGEREERKIVV